MYKCGSVGGHIIWVGPLVRNKVSDDAEIAVKPADLFVAHECDFKQ